MNFFNPSQVTLLPTQLSCLAEHFTDDDKAVGVSQYGSVIYATNGVKQVVIDAKGTSPDNPNQESLPLC